MAKKKDKTLEEIQSDVEDFEFEQILNEEAEELEEVQEQSESADEYKKLLQVVQADFDNYRKRSLTMLNEAKQDGQINVIMKFLPAMDSFKKAKEMIEDANILKGIEMIENELTEALKTFGVEKIEALGQIYDPNLHNVIMVKNDNSLEDDVITDVYQDGYKLKDKVIRYCQVVINKKGE